ncbi:OmpA family protein [Pedobacter sp. UC225_65]|uniref:OmpA family protein n=1 Tax=Pedobacter sp. UC225_65 TaxID=3350173 RepID=UPI00366F07AE
MKTIKIFLVLFCTLSLAKAQMVSNNRRVADVYFINKEYYAAAEYYKRSLQISSDSVGFTVPYAFESKVKEQKGEIKKDEYEYLVFQLASSLRLYKNFQDAEKWYLIANGFTNPKYALSTYWYGDCLRANKKYEDAITAFNNFSAKYALNDGYKEKAELEIQSCRYALNEMKYPRLYKLARLQNDINQAGSNYAPVLNNQIFYFTSSRPVNMIAGKNQVLGGAQNAPKVVRKESPYINTIYAIQDNSARASNVSVKKVPIDVKKMESAAIAFHPNGNIMFITAWVNKDEKIRSIYISRRVGTNWSDPIALGNEINVEGYNSIQPYITKDSKYLVFSSDRPGGSGKYDLWYATLAADGTVGKATNMGSKINTSEDDQAPYYNYKTKKLLYSSNGKVGLGGFDFYESTGDFENWTTPANMGYPFNSAKDDIYFTSLDDQDKDGYISSDRESVCCLEVFQVSRKHLTVTGALIDCATMKPLEGAKITLTGNDIEKQSVLTDANGSYSFQLNSNRGLQLNATMDNYFAKNLNYTYDQLVVADTLLSANLCLEPIVIDKPIVLENIFYEFDKAELTEASKVTLDNLYNVMVDNPNIEIELSAHTDIIGTEAYNLDLSARRARSCVDYLVSKGVSESRMTWRGYGYSQPIAPNTTIDGKDNPEGRALNRRTEFKVTKSK